MIFVDEIVAMEHVYTVPRLIFGKNSDSLVGTQDSNILEGSGFVWGNTNPPSSRTGVALFTGGNLEVDEMDMNRVRPSTTTNEPPLLSGATGDVTENPYPNVNKPPNIFEIS